MDTSIISKKVDSYKKVPESKAGLKDVYIIKSSGNKYVLSVDAGSSRNWLSEEYIEPVVIKWLNKNQADVCPDLVEYDIDEKIMLTKYTGDSDLSDIDFEIKQMRQLGEIIGYISSLGDFDGFGGLICDDKNIISQNLTWQDTLLNILNNVDEPLHSNISMKNITKERIADLDESNILPCLSHGDIKRFSNVRVDHRENIDSLVDWQNAWISDSLTEFLFTRMVRFTPHYSGKKVDALTEGYLSKVPNSVKQLTDEQATVSLSVALLMLYDRDDYQEDLAEFFESLYNTNKTINTDKIIDPSYNLRTYI